MAPQHQIEHLLLGGCQLRQLLASCRWWSWRRGEAEDRQGFSAERELPRSQTAGDCVPDGGRLLPRRSAVARDSHGSTTGRTVLARGAALHLRWTSAHASTVHQCAPKAHRIHGLPRGIASRGQDARGAGACSPVARRSSESWRPLSAIHRKRRGGGWQPLAWPRGPPADCPPRPSSMNFPSDGSTLVRPTCPRMDCRRGEVEPGRIPSASLRRRWNRSNHRRPNRGQELATPGRGPSTGRSELATPGRGLSTGRSKPSTRGGRPSTRRR